MVNTMALGLHGFSLGCQVTLISQQSNYQRQSKMLSNTDKKTDHIVLKKLQKESLEEIELEKNPRKLKASLNSASSINLAKEPIS